MIWWNYKKLAWQLRDNKITVTKETNYWVMFILQLVAMFAPAYMMSGPVTAMSAINNYVIPLAFPVLWVIVGLRVNRMGDNQQFLKRYICLSLPLTVQVTTVIMMVTLLGVQSQTTQILTGGVDALQAMQNVATQGTWW